MRKIATYLWFAGAALASTVACGPRPIGTGGVGGTGGTSGTGGTGATGGSGGSVSSGAPCVTRGSQIVVVGDSYMTVNTPYLVTQQLAAAAGAPTPYRSYAVAGTSMANGQIPGQLTQAILADPDIKLVIMDGGGNDVLINHRECLNPGSSTNVACQQVVQAALDAANQMLTAAMNDGVHDVIYFYYPHIPSGILSGAAPTEMLDYALPKVKAACDGANQKTGGRLTCHFIDLVPLFAGHPEYIGGDQIHPTVAGAQVIGNAIWNVMRTNCLGQAASSACCG